MDPDLFDYRPQGAIAARQKLGLAADVPLLKQEVDAFCKERGINVPSVAQIDDKISEMVRYG